VDVKNISGDTALIMAAARGHIKVVTLLLDRGAELDVKNTSGDTALIRAARGGHTQVVSLLLDRGAELGMKNNSGHTALIDAVDGEGLKTVSLLLDRGAEVDTKSYSGNTALIVAAAQGSQSKNIVSLLLDRGAGIDAVSPGTGPGYGNALITAVASGKLKGLVIVSLLVDRGANLNAILGGRRYPTALIAVAHLATTLEVTKQRKSTLSSYYEVMNMLLDRGAHINLAAENDQYGAALNTAVFVRANHRGKRELEVSKTVSILLDRGADPNIVTGGYGSALGIAAYEGNEQYISLLLDKGADIYHVGGKYPTAGGAYPTAADAAEAGAGARGGKETKAIINLRKLLSGAMDSQRSMSSKLWAPFPMPYSDTYLAPISPSDPTAGKIYTTMSTFEFSTGGNLTSEQACWPCKTLDTVPLITALVALMGINAEAVERNKVWINNDVQYFINRSYDLGLAYAACRVAWRYFNEHAFNVAADRGRWHKKANAIDATRAESIYEDSETRLELIKSPYEVMPRRIWDLKSNRVVEFRMLLSAFLARRDACSNSNPNDHKDGSTWSPAFWAITHSWVSVMKPLETAINQYQWPVPFPEQVHQDGGVGLRQELLELGGEYVWLDVLCLRQQSGNSRGGNHSPQMRVDEWKIDVPTIGNIYRTATGLVRYFNGLGVRFSNHGWDDERHWLRRAWTLQEIRSENTTLNGGRFDSSTTIRSLMSASGTLEGKPVNLRYALRPVVRLAAEVDSPTGCSMYDLSREMDKRYATQATDKVAGLLYLLRTTQLPTYDETISAENAWRHCIPLLPFERKVEILFDFPYRASEEQWFPTWSQLLKWPERDPQYIHVRSVWRHGSFARYNEPNQTSVIIPDAWTIPNVQLIHCSEPKKYHFKTERSDNIYEFYCFYLGQDIIGAQLQFASRLTLATVELGHSNTVNSRYKHT